MLSFMCHPVRAKRGAGSQYYLTRYCAAYGSQDNDRIKIIQN